MTLLNRFICWLNSYEESVISLYIILLIEHALISIVYSKLWTAP